MQKQRTPLVEVEFVRTRVSSSRRRRRKHLRRRNTISDARDAAGLVGHSSKDGPSARVVRCASLTSKARKSTRPNLAAQPQPSTSSGRGASSSPSEWCYSTDGPSFDPSFDASEPSDYCSFVCRRLPKPSQILGVAVALPTPPQHVLTPHRRLPQRANTFRDDVNDAEGIATVACHTSPDTALNSVASSSHASEQVATPSNSDQRSGNVNSTAQGPSRQASADLQRPKFRDEERVLRDEGARSSSGNWSASSSARTSLDLDVQNRNICGDLVNQSLQETLDETTDWSYRNFESDCLDTDELDSLSISLIAGKSRRPDRDDVDHSSKDDNGNSLVSCLPRYDSNDNSEHSIVSERPESRSHQRLKEDIRRTNRKFDDQADSTKVEDQNSSDSTSSSDSSAPRKTSAAAVRAREKVGDGGSTSRSLTPSGKESPALSFGLESAQPSESTAPQSSPSSAQRTHSRTTDDLPSSSSFTSDGTLTPTQDIQDIPFFDDDTSSAYSCDTEGYYTSFHIDSGLRSACSYEDTKLATSASDSETPGGGLGGGGSRSASGSIAGSISNSSAASLGTVIMRNPEKKTPPKPPQRVSSLDRKNSTASNRESIITVIHVNGSAGSSREDLVASSGSETADSGRETSSSATEPTSPRQTITSGADGSAAELERKDSFRSKTAINASGIPSMCVITPPISDDESVRSASGSKNSGNSSGGDDPALGSVAAKAMLFQGGSVGAGSGSVRQVPRIETSKTPPKSDLQQTPPTGSQAASQNKAAPVKALFHSTSVDYSVNVRPSAIKQSDVTRRLSGDGQMAVTSSSNTSLSQKEVTVPQTAPVAPPPRIHKVPPPPPPREDSIDSSTSRKVETYKPPVGEASGTAPTASPRYALQHQQQQIQLQQQLQPQVPIPNAAGAEDVQPFSAVPPSVKQNLVITPTNSLERKRLKATAGAHVTLDSEGKVVYSSDSLPRSHKSLAANDGGRPGNGGLHAAGPLISSGTLPPGISSIQQMPLPPPPIESAPAIPELPVQVTNSVNSSAAALQQHQQHIQQQLMQQQQQQLLQQQQQQQQMLRQEQEEKLQRHRQEELLLQRAVQQQIDQSKQEVLQQQSALKQQHQELQQQLHETRLELQRQQQEQQQKLQALRERQAYLQSKTLPKNSSSSASSDKKHSKQSQKEQNSKEAKLKQEQQQQRLLQQQQQTQQQLVIEQQKQIQLAEQQKQLQLQKQQQQQQLQYQQQQIIQQQQQYQLQQQQHGVYGTRQDPYLFPSMPQSNALSQIPPIVPPPPPADPRQPPEGMGSSSGTPGGVILPSAGAPMSPRSLRAGAYVHVQAGEQMSALQQQQLQQQQQQQQLQQQQQSQAPQNSQYPSRPHSAQGMYTPSLSQQQQPQTNSTPGPTSRAPTPIQGAVTSSPRHSPFTAAATPQQLQQQLLQQQQLALQQQPGQQQMQGAMYGSQRSLQNFGLVNDTASGFPPVVGQGMLQHPRLPTTAPPAYPSQPLTDSDIYGRIGMTRQVQVGGTLPSGFGRHQRGYTSLPPSRRGQMQLPGSDEGRGEGNAGKTAVSRRASVAGDAGSRGSRGAVASNPSTPEKLLEKEKKSSKKEKDKDKKKKDSKEKDKDKEKENKDGKSEKSPKKKWFWTLPLRRKKKTKDENSEDDDGGFKAASEKGTRKLMPPQNSSFMRYPSPDTASSDLNSSHSSEVSSMDHNSSYRSSPSSEVNYYSQRAQYLQQQQQAHQQHLLQLQHQQHQQLLQQQMQAQHQQQLLQQQQQQQQQQQLNAGSNLRSLPTTPISSPDGQGSFVSSSPLTMNSDVTDLTTDVSRTRQYMSRDQMYSAMRHPQYYNYNRHSYAGSATQASAADEANNNSNSTPSSSRSTSPAVFGISPLPSNTVRPQVRERIGHNDDYVSRESQDTPIPFIFKENGFEELKFCKVDPPAGYGATEAGSISPDGDENDHENGASSGSTASGTSTLTSTKPFSKQTTLFDFKKMILQQSMNTAGGKERISAVEMLKASRPSIYGYAPPPAPIIKPSQHKDLQSQQASKLHPKTTIEGVIMPPTSRNTARALLFQSRFGSGRRYRASKTDIISTTILEDHGGELSEEADMEESEEEEEEEEVNVCSPSKRNVRGSLARAYSEPEGALPSSVMGMSTPSSSPGKDRSNVPHSTPNPNKTGSVPPPSLADVSCIGNNEEGKASPPNSSVKTENGTNSSTDESMETAL